MILEAASVAMVIKCLVDAIKAFPKVPRRSLPFIAIGLGAIIYPAMTLDFTIWDWSVVRDALQLGVVAGAGAVGVHEGIGALDSTEPPA